METITMYEYLAEIGDRRTKEYKKCTNELDKLVAKFGKESKQVDDFFNQKYDQNEESNMG